MKRTTVIILFIALSTSIFGQSEKKVSKYGDDSIACVTNISVYVEFVKTGMYEYAHDAWRFVFNNCPASSKNMYTHGVKIMKDLIKKEKDKEKKSNYIDTLMMVYDQRIEYFGQEAYVLGRKGLDFMRYRPKEIEKANEIFTKSVELGKTASEASVLVQYVQTTSVLFQYNKKFKEEMVAVYANAIDILEQKLKTETSPKKITKLNTAKNNVEIIFEKSGAATCETILALFTPRFEKDKENIDLLKRITRMLDKFDCTETPLFYESSENLYRLEPSAEAAYMLAKMFLKKGDYDKSTNYYKEAIENQTDSIQKSKYYYELGILTHSQQSNPDMARSYAYQALKFNPQVGKPYLLIGNVYAASASDCGETDFEKSAVYWAAVDKFYSAKRVDTSLVDEANELIGTYSQYFPGSEDTFFNGYNDGQQYEVKCWINEKTKVRFE